RAKRVGDQAAEATARFGRRVLHRREAKALRELRRIAAGAAEPSKSATAHAPTSYELPGTDPAAALRRTPRILIMASVGSADAVPVAAPQTQDRPRRR